MNRKLYSELHLGDIILVDINGLTCLDEIIALSRDEDGNLIMDTTNTSKRILKDDMDKLHAFVMD